jgi:hypothetical protein
MFSVWDRIIDLVLAWLRPSEVEDDPELRS